MSQRVRMAPPIPIVPQQWPPPAQLSEPEHVRASVVHAMAVLHDSAPRAPMQQTSVAGLQSLTPASSRPHTMRRLPASPVIPASPVDPLDEPLPVPLLVPEVEPLALPDALPDEVPEALPDALPEVLPEVEPDPVDPDEPEPEDDPVVAVPLVEPLVDEPDDPLEPVDPLALPEPEDPVDPELPDDPDPPSPLSTLESEPPHPTATAVPKTANVRIRRRR